MSASSPFLMPPVYCDLDGTQEGNLAWRCPFCYWMLAKTKDQLLPNYLIAPHDPPTPACHGPAYLAKMVRVHCEPWVLAQEAYLSDSYGDDDADEMEGSEEEWPVDDE